MPIVLNRITIHRIALLLLATTLAACTQPPPPSQQAAPKLDVPDAVTAIRDAGAKFTSDLEVHPLRDPAVDGLMQQARSQEIQQHYDQAMALAERALTLSHGSPEIIQYQAELEIGHKHYEAAAKLAQQSYDHGPKNGSLCARNMQTLIEARNALQDSAGAVQAKARLPSCRVDRPVRM
jgi:tetratricopeptide (TPR) repeat protein